MLNHPGQKNLSKLFIILHILICLKIRTDLSKHISRNSLIKIMKSEYSKLNRGHLPGSALKLLTLVYYLHLELI